MYVGEWVSDILSRKFERERGGRMELYSDMWEGVGGGRQILTAHSNRFQFDRVGNTFFSSPPPPPNQAQL